MYTNFEMLFPHNDKCFNGMEYTLGEKEYIYMNDKYIESHIGKKTDKKVKENEVSSGLYDYGGMQNWAIDYPEITGLYGSSKTFLCNSGMQAILCALMFLRRQNYKVFCDKFTYYETVNLCVFLFGDESVVDIRDKDFQMAPHSAYIYSSVIENGTKYDNTELAEMAHPLDSLTVCDNTFAGSRHINPLNEGADIVVDSTTKYYAGDDGFQSGLLVFNDNTINGMSPTSSFCLIRALASKKVAETVVKGINGYNERMRKLEGNAKLVNDFLRSHGVKTEYPNYGSVIWITGININCHNDFSFLQPNDTFGLSHSTYTVYYTNQHGTNTWYLRLSCGVENPKEYLSDLQAIVNAK